MIGTHTRHMFCGIARGLALPKTHFCVLLVLLAVEGGLARAAPQVAASQDPSGTLPSGTDEGSEYNGEDITRPQRRFESRFQYRTSAANNSRIDREFMILRGDWKSILNPRGKWAS